MTLIILVPMLTIGLAYVSTSNVSSSMAQRGVAKSQADLLADAAVQYHFDQIRSYAAQNLPWSESNATVAETTLIGNDGVDRTAGTYSSTATLISHNDNDDTTANIRRTTDVIGITGTGRATNGTTSRAYMTMVITQEAKLCATTTTTTAFAPTVVIQSNAGILLSTNQGFRTHSSGNAYDGSILANDGVTWQPASGNKGSNPNTITVDGMVLAGGDTATTFTRSAAGMGNSNGTKNYLTNATSAQNGFPAATANSITNLGTQKTFADASAVNTWRAQWESDASQGTSFYSSVSTSTAPLVNGERRITAPAYIHGDLNASSGQLYLQPNSDPTKPNIVFVDGAINNATLLYNRGVVLVSTGRYTATNTSAQYALQTQSSPYTLAQLYNKTALVSLAVASNAIDMGVNASSNTGLIYACLGGIQCKANNNFNGVLVAGGTGTNGGVAAGGANSFDITFTPDAIQNRSDFKIQQSGAGSTAEAINKTTVSKPSGLIWR